jgi:cbb3-type cytochrome oxidase subunit 3
MKQLAVTQFPMPILTIIALMIFFVTFALITLWAYRFLSNEKVQQLANLALDNEKEGT